MHMKSRGTILKWVRAVLSGELSWHLRRDVNVQSDQVMKLSRRRTFQIERTPCAMGGCRKSAWLYLRKDKEDRMAEAKWAMGRLLGSEVLKFCPKGKWKKWFTWRGDYIKCYHGLIIEQSLINVISDDLTVKGLQKL